MRTWDGLDEKERTMDVMKGYVEVNDDVENETMARRHHTTTPSTQTLHTTRHQHTRLNTHRRRERTLNTLVLTH